MRSRSRVHVGVVVCAVLCACSGDGGGPADAGPADAGSPDAGPVACNGDPALCDRPYDEVAVACTHNAFSAEEDGYTTPTPNQKYGLLRQLDDGVRCLMLDTYEDFDKVSLCHANCALGRTPFVPFLQELSEWLDRHPGAIVTFVLESYITEAQTEQALRDGGVFERVYHHGAPPGSEWPTLGEMVASEQRLVVLTDDGDASADWYLDWRKYGWETPYDDDTFTCAHGRGDPARYDHQPFILNHYVLCEYGGCEENALDNNAFDFLYDRATRCWHDTDNNPYEHIPTFVNVDHYDVPAPGARTDRPDVLDVVDALNADWP